MTRTEGDPITEREAHFQYGGLVAATDLSGDPYATPAEAKPFSDWSVEYAAQVLERLVERGEVYRNESGDAYAPVLDDDGRMVDPGGEPEDDR